MLIVSNILKSELREDLSFKLPQQLEDSYHVLF